VNRQGLRLSDGRHIDYLEFGDPAGVPAVYLHGTPSSGSEGAWIDRAAREHGVRIVSLDRPGYLGSDPYQGAPSLLAGAEDVVSVARSLGLGRFAVVGFSGGAGYALATASLAPAQVSMVHVGGGLASLAGEGSADLSWQRRIPFKLITAAPTLSAPLLASVFVLLRRGIEKRLHRPAEAAHWFFAGPAQGAQIAAIEAYVRGSDPEELRRELHDYAEGTRATRAIIGDLTAYVRPWPFQLSDLTTTVHLWHGRKDPAAPVASAEAMARQLPNAQLHIFDKEGHFVFHTHADEIAASIREATRTEEPR